MWSGVNPLFDVTSGLWSFCKRQRKNESGTKVSNKLLVLGEIL